MGLKSFQYFLAVAEELSFTRASQRLHIAQQSLSGSIKRLEEEYGVELFRRKPVLRLTPAGELMAFYARNILENEHKMAARLSDLAADCVGHITIGMSRQRSGIFFPGIWERFYSFYPNVSVDLHEQMTLQILDELQRGQLDLGVVVNAPPTRDLERIPLGTERMQCLISEKLLKRQRPYDWESLLKKGLEQGISLLELQDFPFIMLTAGNQLRAPIDQTFSAAKIHPKVILESAEHGVIYRLGCDGYGISLFSPMFLYDHEAGYREPPSGCHLLNIIDPLPNNQVELVYPKDLEDTDYLSGMRNAIIQEFSFYNSSMRMLGRRGHSKIR